MAPCPFENLGRTLLCRPICIGVFGESGTTKIWGGAFAPPAPPLATPLPDVAGDMTDIEPLFYRGRVRRGFHDNKARFFRAKKKRKNVFGFKKKKIKINNDAPVLQLGIPNAG